MPGLSAIGADATMMTCAPTQSLDVPSAAVPAPVAALPNLVQLLIHEALDIKMSAAMLNRLLDRPGDKPFSEACIDTLRNHGVERLSDLCALAAHQIPTLTELEPDDKSKLVVLHTSLKGQLAMNSFDLPLVAPVATLSSYGSGQSFQLPQPDIATPSSKSTQAPVLDEVVPIGSEKDLWAEHEAKHFAGTCQPCAYYYKPDSCKWGAKCDFCHLCPDGEIKARKKEKIRALREQAQREKNLMQNPQVVSLSLSSALHF